MALCNIDTLSEQACANGYENLSEHKLLEVIAVLLWNEAGSTPDLDTLLTQACASGFDNLPEQKLLGVVAQLLCNSQP